MSETAVVEDGEAPNRGRGVFGGGGVGVGGGGGGGGWGGGGGGCWGGGGVFASVLEVFAGREIYIGCLISLHSCLAAGGGGY